MRRILLLALSLVSLSRCAAAKPQVHQPSAFPAYFPERPPQQFSPNYLIEIQALESAPELSLLGKKRLLDLYRVELKSLKPGVDRFETVQTSVRRLEGEVTALEEDVRRLEEETKKLKTEVPTDEKANFKFTSKAAKREYQETYRLWNRDKNEQALKRIEKTLSNEKFLRELTAAERVRLLNLRFRIAMEAAPDEAEKAYQALYAFEKCSEESAQAGFLLALRKFTNNERHIALALLDQVCDPDKSAANRLKYDYWRARIKEANGEPAKLAYAVLLKSPIPGYYAYLAKMRAGAPIEAPAPAEGVPAYRAEPLLLQGEVAQWVKAAEERLKANLKRDASVYLVRAARELSKSLDRDRLRALLYVAHLLQGAGSNLEAIKIFSLVTSELLEERQYTKGFPIDFLAEMFPRPHGTLVESLSRSWEVDPDFVYAIMRQESAFNPGAVSTANARGLMQLMPQLARSISQSWSYNSYYADRLLFVAEENLKIAIYHLHQLFSIVPHPALVAASYNAGLSRVSGWWRRNGGMSLDVFVEFIPINETRNYVKLVIRNFLHYKSLRVGGAIDPSAVPHMVPPPAIALGK
jgi:soluble lytic murein transglycosylase-like protein